MISIITPTNKLTPFFSYTFTCVMCQTYKDFEWVILDNSPEGYVKSFFDKYKTEHPEYNDMYSKVKIFREYLLGKSVGYYKNKCVELTTCKDNEYILVYDHDDFMANTTLEDIAGCDRKYKEKIDYITGDLTFGTCLDDKNEFYIENEDAYKTIYGFDMKTYTNENTVEAGVLKADKVVSATMYGYDIERYDNILLPHPRAIKKHWLNTPIFRFYEGQRYEEDGLQIALAPLILNIGWIARPTVFYVVHTVEGEAINASKCGYKDFIDVKNHYKILSCRKLLYAAFSFFYSDKDKKRKFFRYEDFPKK